MFFRFPSLSPPPPLQTVGRHLLKAYRLFPITMSCVWFLLGSVSSGLGIVKSLHLEPLSICWSSVVCVCVCVCVCPERALFRFCFLINLFIYFWLRWVFVAARGLSRCGEWVSHRGGFSCCGAQALGAWASVVAARRLSSYGSWALECRLSSCGTRA